jgi:WD40 repeat protein
MTKASAMTILTIAFFLWITAVNGQQPRLMLPAGHLSGVSDASFSRDGKYIVTASHDFTARIWSVAGGQLLVELAGHLRDVNSACFSPDGKQVLTASDDHTARIWNASTGDMLFTLAGHRDRVQSALFSPDGKIIATTSADRTVKTWNAADGKLVHDLKGHQGEINSTGFSPDGKLLVTASEDFTAKVWNVFTGQLTLTLKGLTKRVKDARFSPDGHTIVTASWDHVARLWDASSGKALLDLPINYELFNSAVFSPDGKLVLTTAEDSIARVWNTQTGGSVAALPDPDGDINMAAFSPDGRSVVTVAAYGTKPKLWDSSTGRMIFELNGHNNIIRSARFSPDGRWLVTSSDDRTARIWNLATGQLSINLKGHTSQVDQASFSPGGNWVVSRSRANLEQLWNASNGKPEPNLNRFVTFSADGSTIASLSWNDDGLKLWKAATGQLIANLGAFSLMPDLTSFSADGRSLLTVSDSIIRIWNVESGRLVASRKALVNFTHQPEFSPDGRWVQAALNDSTINIWNVANGQLLASYPAMGAAFSGDGKLLATASPNQRVSLWNLLTGKRVGVFPGDAVLFSPNSTMIITTTRSGTGKPGPGTLWSTRTGRQIFKATGVLEFSPDGALIFTATHGGFAAVWDASSLKLLTTLKGNTTGLVNAAFSPDKRSLVTTSTNQGISLWSTANGKLVAGLGRFTALIHYPVFSPGSNWLIIRWADSNWLNRTKGWNKTLIVDAVTGAVIRTITAERNEDFEGLDLVNKRLASRRNSEISVYDMLSGHKLYSTLAVDSTDYLNRLPSGYYMSTPGAARLLHYVTNDLKVITFAQLDLKYNRPDMVLTAIGYPDTALVNSYRNVYYKRLKKLNIDTTSFRDGYSVPEADFSNRDIASAEQDQDSLRLHIHAQDSIYRLDRFNVWVNQVPVFGTRGVNIRGSDPAPFDTALTILLSEGPNTIETSVTNANGTESYRMPLLVRFRPRQPARQRTYFIGIGIDHFADTKFDLQWSVKDIRDLALGMKEKCKGQLDIDTLFNRDVTVSNVKALKQKLQRMSINDKLIIAYSGHGLLSRDYDYYLSTYTVDFSHPEQNGLAYDELNNLLDSIPPRRKLLLIDACHSGEVDKQEMDQYKSVETMLDSGGIRRGVVLINKDSSKLGMKGSVELMQELFVNVGKTTGATIISAAAGTQFALEKNNLKNGVFTYSLLEYLQQHEHATINELKTYVNHRVRELTAGLQVPTARNENTALDWEVW